MKKNHFVIAITCLFFAGAIVGLGLIENTNVTEPIVKTKTNDLPNKKLYGFVFYEEPASYISYQK
ncbi:hypothetical protein [Paenibacillus sp. P36]|uniref:hypothetical protein n=1 Tax=Paenibacillus sp. P36 TaxID=3342538 RepID=UPI0038B315A0